MVLTFFFRSTAKLDFMEQYTFDINYVPFCFVGLFCVIGILLYPVGWSSDKVKNYCGEASSAFSMDKCSFGRCCLLNEGFEAVKKVNPQRKICLIKYDGVKMYFK